MSMLDTIERIRRGIGAAIDRMDAGTNLDRMLAFFDAKVANLEPLVRAGDDGPARESFASGIPFREQFQAKLRPHHLPRLAPVFPRLMWNMLAGGRYYRERFVPRSDTAPTEFFSARLRINVIYTNIENLPERPNPHLWVRDFCAMCRECVRSCPPSAIHHEPQDRPAAARLASRSEFVGPTFRRTSAVRSA